MSDDNHDVTTEVRLWSNGSRPCRDNPGRETARKLAWNADHEPPTPHKIDAIKSFAGNWADPVDDRASERKRLVEVCKTRYQKGFPVSETKRQQCIADIDTQLDDLHEPSPPPGWLDQYGQINRKQLSDALTDAENSHWPRDDAGQLRTDSETLREIGTPIANRLLASKLRAKRDPLARLSITSDGRNCQWANPYGTSTGRENPRGAGWTRLDRKHRDEVITPPPDFIIVEIDYRQEEPAIAGVLANQGALLKAYEAGDVYDTIAESAGVSRDLAKVAMIRCLYGGGSVSGIQYRLGLSEDVAITVLKAISALLPTYTSWSNRYVQDAYSAGVVRSRDWRMTVDTQTAVGTLRNWPIQATGADILREALLRLDSGKIPVVGALHDSVLIEIPRAESEPLTAIAQTILHEASAAVLNGFPLRTSLKIWDSASDFDGGDE